MGTYNLLLQKYLRWLYGNDATIIPIFITNNQNNQEILNNIVDHAKKLAIDGRYDYKLIEAKLSKCDFDYEIVSFFTYSNQKYDNAEQKLLKYLNKKKILVADLTRNKLKYENNYITKDLYTEDTYTDTLMDPSINTSLRSNLNAAMFVIEHIEDKKMQSRYRHLFEYVASTVLHYGIPVHNQRYRYDYKEMYNKPYYLVPWANSSIEMIFAVSSHELYLVAEELIVNSFSNRSTLAKLTSSPMTTLTSKLDLYSCYMTTENLELEYSDKIVKSYITDEAQLELDEQIAELRKEKMVRTADIIDEWQHNPNIDTFPLMAQIYSFSFHVGYRKQMMLDAVTDQLSIEYSDYFDKDMYDMYASNIIKIIDDMLRDYVKKEDKMLLNSEIAGLLSMSSASNGESRVIKFGKRMVRSTKKNMHVMDDIFSQQYNLDVPDVDETKPIPLGRRDVPGRRTRVIFILPYPYFIAQHSVVELYLRESKHIKEFSEFYSQSSQLLSYGDTNRYLNQSTIIVYADVSQWDSSKHNTTPLRNAILKAIEQLKSYTTNEKIITALNNYAKTQIKLKNSFVTIGSKVLQYGAVASGEKQTKLMNSIANLALITTVINYLNIGESYRIKILRVDGDDNYFIMEFDRNVDKQLVTTVSNAVKDTYGRMDVKVKALTATTGLEMAKRYIAGGRLFFRAGVNILNNEKRTHTTTYDQAAIIYANYLVNKMRGYNMERSLILCKIMQMTSVRITGSMRLFPASLMLTTNSPYKVFDDVDFVQTYNSSAIAIHLQKMLISVSKVKSNLADDIAKSEKFNNYVQFLTKKLLVHDNKIVEMGIARTEKAKLNSYPPIANEKRNNQLKTLMTFLQIPTYRMSTDVTINDMMKIIDEYTNYTMITDKYGSQPNPMPLLPENIQFAMSHVGARVYQIEESAAKSAISKLISNYTVYKPSVDELYKVINSNEKMLFEYVTSFGVPTRDVAAYLSAKLYKKDRNLILESYIYQIMSVNYNAYQLFNLNSELFDKYINIVTYMKIPSVNFIIFTYLKLVILNKMLQEKKLYKAYCQIPKHLLHVLWKMSINLATISSPYAIANFFQE
uniref:RNA-directed RNA polymerase n=1 Tax=Rotavirus D TaxID=335100 RepID=A0A346BLI0_9REOV|nr:VP1 [Rotavirus D]